MQRLHRDPSLSPALQDEELRADPDLTMNDSGHLARLHEILEDLESINNLKFELACPSCFRPLQRYGRKVGSNSVVFQRFVCPDCRTAGRKYNYFLDINLIGGSSE